MKRTHIYTILFSLCALVILTTISLTHAQDLPVRIEITEVNTDQFPQIDVYVTAVSANGKRFPGLYADMVDLFENGSERVPSVFDTPRGTELIFLIDADMVAQSYWDEIREAITGYATISWMDEELDYVTIIVANGQESNTLVKEAQFHTSVSNAFISESGGYYEPPTTPTTPLYDLIGETLNGLDKEAPNAGMYRALVIFSSGDLIGNTFSAEGVNTLAKEKNIPLYTVLLGDTPGGEQALEHLAHNSNGQSYRLDEITSMWEVLTSYRKQYSISYPSQIVTSGSHVVKVQLADDSNTSDTRNFEITVLNPTVEITLPKPNTVIARQPSGSSSEVVDYEPKTQAVKYLWDWPDQHERQVHLVQLRVNGAVQQQLDLTVSDNRDLIWDIATLGPGPYSLRVEVTDELGLTGQSPEIPVMIEIQDDSEADSTPSPSPDVTITPSPGIFAPVTDMFKSTLDGIKRNLGCLGSGFSVAALLIVAFAFRRRLSSMARSPLLFLRRQPFFRPIDAILRPIERMVGPIKLKRKKKTDEKEKEKEEKEAAQEERIAGKPKRPGKSVAWVEVITSQVSAQRRIELTKELTFGRSAEKAQIVLAEKTMSRLHARINPEHGGKYRVYNHSSQSTWVNDQRVPEHGLLLNNGDKIRMGKVQLLFQQQRQ